MRPLYAQVVWGLANSFERTLGKIAQGKLEPNEFLKKVEYSNATDLSGKDVDEFCSKYVYAGIEHTKKFKQFTIATDKGHVCKLPLQDTAISTPRTNDVILCTPHVGDRIPILG